jgi:hypothetical protein
LHDHPNIRGDGVWTWHFLRKSNRFWSISQNLSIAYKRAIALFLRSNQGNKNMHANKGGAFDFDFGVLDLAIFTKIKPFLVNISKPINRTQTSDSSFSSQQSGQQEYARK